MHALHPCNVYYACTICSREKSCYIGYRILIRVLVVSLSLRVLCAKLRAAPASSNCRVLPPRSRFALPAMADQNKRTFVEQWLDSLSEQTLTAPPPPPPPFRLPSPSPSPRYNFRDRKHLGKSSATEMPAKRPRGKGKGKEPEDRPAKKPRHDLSDDGSIAHPSVPSTTNPEATLSSHSFNSKSIVRQQQMLQRAKPRLLFHPASAGSKPASVQRLYHRLIHATYTEMPTSLK